MLCVYVYLFNKLLSQKCGSAVRFMLNTIRLKQYSYTRVNSVFFKISPPLAIFSMFEDHIIFSNRCHIIFHEPTYPLKK